MRRLLWYLLLSLFCSCSIAEEYSPLFPCTSVLEDTYGICSHISRSNSDLPFLQKELDLMQKMGVDYVRTDFDWYNIQRSVSDPISVWHLDSIVSETSKKGIKILPILGYTIKGCSPVWSHIEEWNEYVRFLITRYKSQCPAWEVWNEMNIQQYWKGSIENYFYLLNATRVTMNTLDSSLLLTNGGLSGVDKSYTNFLTSPSCNDSYDIFNFHFYTNEQEPRP